MEKSTLYLVVVIIIAVTILGVAGEYFAYKYAALSSQQSVQQSAMVTSSSESSSSSPAILTSGSSEKSIASFNFKNPLAVGTIDDTNYTVTITVPPDTDVTNLSPTIQVSNSAIISPASGIPQDFTNPVTYTVTAQNGSVQKYVATVNVASITTSIQKLITSFKLASIKPQVDGFINNDNYTIYVVVPDGTDLTKLAPTIEVSQNAIISPASGTPQDFTNPVIYTVTDVYGGTQIYTVTIVTESNSG